MSALADGIDVLKAMDVPHGLPGANDKTGVDGKQEPSLPPVVPSARVARLGHPGAPPAPGAPNPSHWELFHYAKVGRDLVVVVRYPDCTNFEGLKILVYIETSPADLITQKRLDPHFSGDPKLKTPFARFEPTVAGWNAAKALVTIMSGKLPDQRKDTLCEKFKLPKEFRGPVLRSKDL